MGRSPDPEGVGFEARVDRFRKLRFRTSRVRRKFATRKRFTLNQKTYDTSNKRNPKKEICLAKQKMNENSSIHLCTRHAATYIPKYARRRRWTDVVYRFFLRGNTKKPKAVKNQFTTVVIMRAQQKRHCAADSTAAITQTFFFERIPRLINIFILLDAIVQT